MSKSQFTIIALPDSRQWSRTRIVSDYVRYRYGMTTGYPNTSNLRHVKDCEQGSRAVHYANCRYDCRYTSSSISTRALDARAFMRYVSGNVLQCEKRISGSRSYNATSPQNYTIVEHIHRPNEAPGSSGTVTQECIGRCMNWRSVRILQSCRIVQSGAVSANLVVPLRPLR